MSQYRKKPVVVEAIQATKEQILKWLLKEEPYPKDTRMGIASYHAEDRTLASFLGIVETLEGDMKFGINDWIITGVKGEVCFCKPDIFEMTYEPADNKKQEVSVEALEIELRSHFDSFFHQLHFYIEIQGWYDDGIKKTAKAIWERIYGKVEK